MKIWFTFFFTAAFINTALFINPNGNVVDKSESKLNENTENFDSTTTLKSTDILTNFSDTIETDNLQITNQTITTKTITNSEDTTTKNNITDNNLNAVANNTDTNAVDINSNSSINHEIAISILKSSEGHDSLKATEKSDSKLNNTATNNAEEMLPNASTFHENQTTAPENPQSIPNSSEDHDSLKVTENPNSELIDTATNNQEEMLPNASTFPENRTTAPENPQSIPNSSEDHDSLKVTENPNSELIDTATNNQEEMLPNASTFTENRTTAPENPKGIPNSSEGHDLLKATETPNSELIDTATNNQEEMLPNAFTIHENQATASENPAGIFNSSGSHDSLKAPRTTNYKTNNTAPNVNEEMLPNPTINNNVSYNEETLDLKHSTQAPNDVETKSNLATIKNVLTTENLEYSNQTTEKPYRKYYQDSLLNFSLVLDSSDEPEDGNTSETTMSTTTSISCADTIEILDFMIIPFPFSFSLTWSSNPLPENEECSFEYLIKWKAKTESTGNENKTSDTEYTIDNLNACEEYEISITAVSTESEIETKNNPVSQTNKTDEAIAPVENLDFNVEDKNTLFVHWTISPKVEKCLKVFNNYNIRVYKDGEYINSWGVDNNYTTINDVNNCLNTTIEVRAQSTNNISEPASVSYFVPQLNDPPIYIAAEIEDNFVKTKWSFGNYVCRPETFYVTCYVENQEPIREDGKLNVETNELYAIIQKIEPYTNYTCYGIIVNQEGDSKRSEPGRFLTKSKPPDAPEILTITEYNNEYLYIRWEPPKKWNGKEEQYNISIEYIGLNYELPENCKEINYDPFIKIINWTETEYNFSTIIPASTYKISVKAKTDGGWGKGTARDFHSEEGIPDKPEMNTILIPTTNNISLHVTWSIPCKMHGELIGFHIELCGKNEECISKFIEGKILCKIFENLNSDYEYTVNLQAQNNNHTGKTAENSITTPPGSPDQPEKIVIFEFANEYLNITWDPPNEWNGEPEQYNVSIEYVGPNYNLTENCNPGYFPPFSVTLDSKETNLNFSTIIPASQYRISVQAKSSGGWGEEKGVSFNLSEACPEKPIMKMKLLTALSEIYDTVLNLTWSTPCKMNGILKEYHIKLSGTRDKYEEHLIKDKIVSKDDSDFYWNVYDLKPDYKYTVQLRAKNKYCGEAAISSFSSPAGIPNKPNVENLLQPTTSTLAEPWNSGIVYINKDIFDKTMGDILYYAIIVATADCKERPKKEYYNPKIWPIISSDNTSCKNESSAYEATPQWNPLDPQRKSEPEIIYILGKNYNCTVFNNCNRPLKPSTEYFIKIRGFTKNSYSDTNLLFLQTAAYPSEVPVGLIVGLIVGILAIAFIIAAVLFHTKGKLNFKNWPRMESASQISPAPLPVPIKKFGQHYEKMVENPGKIKNEFQLLSTISSDVTLSTKTALLPINKKKNRYINILPYDQTRVTLHDNNANSSDYINASFIKGYSGSNEYIATQGPTEATCPTFWQMILEQNVKLIVMLTQFVESGKDKCYKYFPDLKEEYDLLNEIKIQCVEEEILNVYNKRVFKVKKGNTSKKVTHIQFNLWPDFGVPDEVHHMIDFCEIIKDIKLKKPSIIVMHCSAGVGRTGTLIAVDILLQTIRDKRKVDIFGTVLNLRKQRMTMVQSERQYEFLYKCVYYVINKSKSGISPSKHNINQIRESNML